MCILLTGGGWRKSYLFTFGDVSSDLNTRQIIQKKVA